MIISPLTVLFRTTQENFSARNYSTNKNSVTINVPVVYTMTRYAMILRLAISITRAIGRGGPWKSRLFWALKWQRAKRVSFAPKKVDTSLEVHYCTEKSLLVYPCHGGSAKSFLIIFTMTSFFIYVGAQNRGGEVLRVRAGGQRCSHWRHSSSQHEHVRSEWS
jgi:hypothetical protein